MSKYHYVECRTLGHSWDQIPSTRRPTSGILMTFRCVRCTSIREDTLNSLYEVVARRYVKPDDYHADRRGRSDWRRALAAMPGPRKLLTTGTGREGQ